MADLSSDAILDLYSCMDQPQRWRSVLDRFCADLEARSAVVQIFRRDGLQLRERWSARDSFSTANAALHDALVNNDENPRTDLRLCRPMTGDVIVRDRDAFAPHCPRLADFSRRLSMSGLGESVGLNFPLADDSIFSLVLHRASNNPREFSSDVDVYLRTLLPHLKQMTQMMMKRQALENGLAGHQAALHDLNVGVVICDQVRRILWANDTARRILSKSPHLFDSNGVLQCVAVEDDRKLSDMLMSISRGRRDRLPMALGEPDEDGVQILMSSVPQGDPAASLAAPQVRVALLLSEARRPRAFPTQVVAELFRLSKAEAALAAALCSGKTIEEHARSRQISVGTARVQLKHVLAKVDVRRQAELVSVICLSVAGQSAALPN